MAGRIPPTALMKRKVQARVKKKFGRVVCERCKKKPRGVKLKYHHINMRSYDTRSTNLSLLCPNCHDIVHSKVTIRVHRNGIFGEKSRVTRVKKKPAKKKVKKQRVGETVVKKLKDSNGKLRSYKVKKVATGQYKKTLVRPKRKVVKKRRRSSGFGWF